MGKCSNLNNVMETRSHFKNGASPKSHMSRENISISKMFLKFSKIPMVVIMVIFLVSIANAQTVPNTTRAETEQQRVRQTEQKERQLELQKQQKERQAEQKERLSTRQAEIKSRQVELQKKQKERQAEQKALQELRRA
jgi:uncharacterized protein HemX